MLAIEMSSTNVRRFRTSAATRPVTAPPPWRDRPAVAVAEEDRVVYSGGVEDARQQPGFLVHEVDRVRMSGAI
jgi:hypothetical protein